MIFEALNWEQAAAKAGVPARSMRRALHRPYVLKYLREERQVLLAAISTATPLRLAQLRDQSSNMNAAVAAARALEGMPDANGPGPGRPTAPGFVLIFHEGGPVSAPVTIDASRADDAPLPASD
jgi:hypothetical protein